MTTSTSSFMCEGTLYKYSLAPLTKKQEYELGMQALEEDRIFTGSGKMAADTKTACPSRTMSSGKMNARETLFRANLRFAISQAREYRGIGVEDEDLPFVAALGLWRAIQNYNPEKGASVCTHSVRYIRNAIFDAANKYGERQHLTDRENRALVQIKKAFKIVQMNFKNPEAQLQEVSRLTDIPVKKIEDLLFCSEKMVSGNQPAGNSSTGSKNSGENAELFSLLAAKSVSPEENAIASCMKDELLKSVYRLEENERNVYMMANGFGYRNALPHSLSDIARHFGKTRQWAHWKLKEANRHIAEQMADWM